MYLDKPFSIHGNVKSIVMQSIILNTSLILNIYKIDKLDTINFGTQLLALIFIKASSWLLALIKIKSQESPRFIKVNLNYGIVTVLYKENILLIVMSIHLRIAWVGTTFYN